MSGDLDVEETNRIRVAMGFPPLPKPGETAANNGLAFKAKKAGDNSDDEPASTLETRAAAAGDNWKKVQDDEAAKKQRDARKEAIRKARDNAQRMTKLEGKTLGENEEADVSTRDWLLGQKKRQKKIEKAKQMQQELEEREKTTTEYTAKDLAGVKVGHDLGDFDAGEDQILTLKDADVNDEEEDQLEAAGLLEKERLEEKLDKKKRKRDYDPNDYGMGEKGVLSKYDEEIEGKKRKTFALDQQGTSLEAQRSAEESMIRPDGKKGVRINLNLFKDDKDATPASDYMEAKEVKVKKPKKSKKSKSMRKKEADEEDVSLAEPVKEPAQLDVAMDVDGATKKKEVDDNFVDDDDLQAQLAKTRREALKARKQKKARPEDIAQQLREEASETPMETVGDGEEEEPGLVIDETSQFVANLRPESPPPERKRAASSVRPTTEVELPDGATWVPSKELSSKVKAEPESDDEMPDVDPRNEYDTPERSASAIPEISTTGLDQEKTISSGLGSTLSMLRDRGLVKETGAARLNEEWRKRDRFMKEKETAEEKAQRDARGMRERDRASGRLDKMSKKEQEAYAQHQNIERERLESRKVAQMFDQQYQPSFELRYHDEHGRDLNQKEAFKHLSHQFHGKGSGKQKTDKLLKKIEDEKKREAMSTLDSSQHTGMSNAMGATARKNRQAGVRLQ